MGELVDSQVTPLSIDGCASFSQKLGAPSACGTRRFGYSRAPCPAAPSDSFKNGSAVQ